MIKWTMILLVGVALSGCNSTETGAQSSDARAKASPATEIAPSTPTPAAVATSDSDILTSEGWGPLRIGMTRAEIEAALGPDANPDAVGGPDPEQCEQFRPVRAPEGMLLMLEDQKLARISLSGNRDIKTPQGFGVGDSAARIKQALGSRIEIEPHKYADAPAEYLTFWNGAAAKGDRDYVDDPAARGIRYEINPDGTVGIVHAGNDAIQYVEGCL